MISKCIKEACIPEHALQTSLQDTPECFGHRSSTQSTNKNIKHWTTRAARARAQTQHVHFKARILHAQVWHLQPAYFHRCIGTALLHTLKHREHVSALLRQLQCGMCKAVERFSFGAPCSKQHICCSMQAIHTCFFVVGNAATNEISMNKHCKHVGLDEPQPMINDHQDATSSPAAWSSGMILGLGPRGPGFNSRSSPCPVYVLNRQRCLRPPRLPVCFLILDFTLFCITTYRSVIAPTSLLQLIVQSLLRRWPCCAFLAM